MGEREIRVIAVDIGADRSPRLVERRPGWLLRRLGGCVEVPHVHGDLYWPIDLAVAAATVKLPFRSPRPVAVPVARDAVTGQHGVVDRPLREDAAVVAAEGEIVAAEVDGGDAEWREFARDQIVRRFRPSQIDDLRFVERKRAHLPYHVVRLGGSAFLVDRLTGRVDHPERHASVRVATGRPMTAITAETPR